MQAKDGEIAWTQEQLRQLRQQVSLVAVRCELHVVCVVTRGPPDCRRLS